MTIDQLKTLGMARRWGEKTIPAFDEGQYRMVIRNVGGVAEDASGRVSTKGLDNRGMENVMAWFESVGYHQPNSEPGYWTAKALRYAKHEITDREIRLIEELSSQQPYELSGLIARVTRQRTSDLKQLSGHEAHNLIEALKQIVARQEESTAEPDNETASARVRPGMEEPEITDEQRAADVQDVPF